MRPLVAPALVIAAVAVATVGGALLFQAAGYAPCELCLQERWPYYIGTALALVTAALAAAGLRRAALGAFGLLAVLFLGSAAFGVYHAGVEWGWWPGPTGCTGALTAPAKVDDFLKSLNTTRVVRCDAVAIRILGLSLAGYNALISMALAVGSATTVSRSVRS